MTDIKELEARLKNTKKDYKEALRTLKRQYKSDRKDVIRHYKKCIKDIEKQIKLSKQNKKPSNFSVFLTKASRSWDSTMMAVCNRFESKADDLRYKQSDPDGYEADAMIEEIALLTERFEKKVEKGKKLSESNLHVVANLLLALGTVIIKQLGTKQRLAKSLQTRLIAISPDTNNMQSADKMLKQLDDVLENM